MPDPRIRASYVQEFLRELDHLGEEGAWAVRGAVRPDTRALVEAATSIDWLPVQAMVEIVAAVERDRGLAALRRISRESVVACARLPLFRPFVEGGLRLFGVAPGALIRLAPAAWGALYRECGTLEVASSAPGEAIIVHRGIPEVIAHPAYLAAIAAGLEATITLCKRVGRAAVERKEDLPSRVAYALRWDEAPAAGTQRA